jgi:hypothetical protein
MFSQATSAESPDVSAQGFGAMGKRAPGVRRDEHVRRGAGIGFADTGFGQRFDTKSVQVLNKNFHRESNELLVFAGI